MDAQQDFFIALKKRLEEQGLAVYDNGLPPADTPYPFVYLAESRQNGYAAKAQESGYITQVVQVWGRATQRGTISELNRVVRQVAGSIARTDEYAFHLLEGETEQMVRNDNTTKTPLMQGYSSLRLFFSRR